jgi:hypothetical protein
VVKVSFQIGVVLDRTTDHRRTASRASAEANQKGDKPILINYIRHVNRRGIHLVPHPCNLTLLQSRI